MFENFQCPAQARTPTNFKMPKVCCKSQSFTQQLTPIEHVKIGSSNLHFICHHQSMHLLIYSTSPTLFFFLFSHHSPLLKKFQHKKSQPKRAVFTPSFIPPKYPASHDENFEKNQAPSQHHAVKI
jgi:hypothetical protein